MTNPLGLPHPPPPGDWQSFIQRGATIQTYRLLAHQCGQALSAVAQAIDTLCAVPFPIGDNCTLDEIAINCTVLAAGSSARVGIYRSVGRKNVYPGALVISPAAFVTTSAGFKNNAAVANLSPGLYWAVYNAGVLAPTVSTIPVAGTTPQNPILGWNNTPAALHSLRAAFAYAAMPATFPAGAALNVGPATAVWGRFSA